MHQPLVVKRTTKYLAWKCNAVFASTRIHFISFQGFYREYRAVQGLINDRGHLFRRDTHFILLNVKLFTAKLYIFRRKWWVFIFKVFEEKKKKKIPTQIFWHFTVGRGGQTNIFFFWPNCILLTYESNINLSCAISESSMFQPLYKTFEGIFKKNSEISVWTCKDIDSRIINSTHK